MMKNLYALCPVALSLILLSLPVYSQEAGNTDENGHIPDPDVTSSEIQAVGEATPASTTATLSFDSARALGSHIEERISQYIAAVEEQATNPAVIQAIEQGDPDELTLTAMALQEVLTDSLKARLFKKGREDVDNASTPACGYACVAIAESAYETNPEAEALLYNSPDANILLARAVKSKQQNIGTLVVHYPYDLIQTSVDALKNIGLYTEFRQTVGGKSTTMITHGKTSLKQGSARQVVRIANTSWDIAVWTPGGIAVEKYEPPSIPWFHVGLGIAVLIGGIAALVIVRKKRPTQPKQLKPAKPAVFNPESMSSDDEDEDSKTLIMGGGASEVDVSKYLKASGVQKNNDE